MHISNLYHSEPTSRLAAASRGDVVSVEASSFRNSGSEAVEAAIKFARRVGNDSGRTELFAFERSFHGRTMGALSLTWTPKYREPFAPLLPDTGFLPWGDLAAAAERVGPKTAARPHRARAGRGRPAPRVERVPAGPAEALHRARRAFHRRRDPVRLRPHRQDVRLRTRGHHPRHPHGSQAPRRRPAHGRHPPRRTAHVCEAPRRRPRLDLRRQSGVRRRLERHPRPAHRSRLRRVGGEEGRAARAQGPASKLAAQAQESRSWMCGALVSCRASSSRAMHRPW
jgi:hypothetical protein